MTIPDFQSIMLPLLKYSQDGKEHSMRETIEALAAEFKLTDDERRAMVPSGVQPTFDNRVAWARTYLKKAGLLQATRRGYLSIADSGRELLKKTPAKINIKMLNEIPAFKEFHTKINEDSGGDQQKSDSLDSTTPEELLAKAFLQIRRELSSEILARIQSCSPAFFERLVIELLLKLGYGGSLEDASQHLGRSGDGGIDGIIKEDRLGLDAIYIQAKRWKEESTVGRPEIQKFVGALQGNRAKKGVFLTTSSFSAEAIEYVLHIDNKVALIGGERLVSLMIDHDLGVTAINTYQIKRVDSDYFTE